MKEGPNIAIIAALVGDPARANMLNALLGGAALTASELAGEAGVTLQTASSHLSKLQQARLIEQEQQGRHRYFRLAGSDVADVLEGLGTLAARAGHLRVRPGPKDPAMRRARMCYDHLAGELGVRMFDSLVGRKMLTVEKDASRSRRAARNSSPSSASISKRCRPRAARSARNASTGANAAAISPARSVRRCSIACST